MYKFFLKLNNFIRDLLLDDVDKPYNKPLPYHKKFNSIERKKSDIIHKRAQQRKEQTKGF